MEIQKRPTIFNILKYLLKFRIVDHKYERLKNHSLWDKKITFSSFLLTVSLVSFRQQVVSRISEATIEYNTNTNKIDKICEQLQNVIP